MQPVSLELVRVGTGPEGRAEPLAINLETLTMISWCCHEGEMYGAGGQVHEGQYPHEDQGGPRA